MKRTFLALLLLATSAHAAEKILTKDIADNREVRLVAASIARSRGQNLVASFVGVGDENGTVFRIRFPAHSHTTHETTLMNIIRSSVDWEDGTERWKKAKYITTFSIPKNVKNSVNDLTHWYFVSLHVPGQTGEPNQRMQAD